MSKGGEVVPVGKCTMCGHYVIVSGRGACGLPELPHKKLERFLKRKPAACRTIYYRPGIVRVLF